MRSEVMQQIVEMIETDGRAPQRWNSRWRTKLAL